MSPRPDRLTRLRSCVTEVRDAANDVMAGRDPAIRLAAVAGMLAAANPDDAPHGVDAGLWRALVANGRRFADRTLSTSARRDLAPAVLGGATAVLADWPAFRAAPVDQSRKDIFG